MDNKHQDKNIICMDKRGK